MKQTKIKIFLFLTINKHHNHLKNKTTTKWNSDNVIVLKQPKKIADKIKHALCKPALDKTNAGLTILYK